MTHSFSSRVARVVLACVLVLAPGVGGSAGSKDDFVKRAADREAEVPAEAAPEQAQPRGDAASRFIEANVLETLYHELGHALIDTLDLPVYGPEEFAADFFAAYLIDRVHDEPVTRQLVADVARAYETLAAEGEPVAWDEHGEPMQRYYNLVCLYYGGGPELRADALESFALPEDRAEDCVAERATVDASWGAVVDRLGAGAPGGSITLDWVLDRDSHLTRYVTREVAALNRIMVLPKPVVVSVIPCGEDNAYYEPDRREVIICTELADALRKMAPAR